MINQIIQLIFRKIIANKFTFIALTFSLLHYTTKPAVFDPKVCKLVRQGNIAAIVPFINRNNCNQLSTQGYTLLQYAVHATPTMMQFLFEQGANANTRDRTHKTALHHLSMTRVVTKQKTAEKLHLLLDAQAEINAIDSNGCTPLDLALQAKRLETAILLFENGGILHKETGASLSNNNPDFFSYLLNRQRNMIRGLSTSKIQPHESSRAWAQRTQLPAPTQATSDTITFAPWPRYAKSQSGQETTLDGNRAKQAKLD